ncbi:helix-turn-helix domain-containing protein [Curtobacterium flaccumfaciens]|uniref:Helix-turn-helix domain-containing protein n=1 Tax=Curtobacterium poinsettiae TaxID=159612 RepID=A0A9Q9P984_9MICO|nr:helix-turn-helix domain-containing protein [Curtobacterium flaccumfaciens]UXN26140.1 helix-turn-helix domain-containing protein [Curtobacterium flaccumfaciens]UYC80982.1 helix-turn-helix domain-containing protein [Curtobacterium flaccumfaciens pv. poinsettiae]
MKDAPDDRHALDVPELAKWLNISEWKARELGNDLLFPSFRVGRAHRFWPSEVRAYLSEPRDPWKQSPQSRGRKRVGRPQAAGYRSQWPAPKPPHPTE